MSHSTRAALAFLAATAVTCPAQSQEAIALDAAAAEGSGNWGFAVDARAGYRTGIPRTWPLLGALYGWIFQFEIIGGYRHLFVDAGDLHLGRIGGGMRVGGSFDWFQPFLFSHCSAADANGMWGVLVDFGGALDWRLKTWSLGIHYAHDWLHLDTGWTDLNEVGAHVEIRGFWL